MIFCDIRSLHTASEKSFFVEQLHIYLRIIEEYAENHEITSVSEDCPYDEMMAIGVIKDKLQLPLLKDLLGSQYGRFEAAVRLVRDNHEELFPLVCQLYNSYRREMQQLASESNNPTLVDFFCGAGGLSLGFRQSGYNIVLANDIEDVCIATYKYNHPEVPTSRVLQGDIKVLIDNIDQYVDGAIDIVVGGPPCQGFSSANKNHRVIDDPRNKLYKYFIGAVQRLAPKFVVMENVKGMLKVADQVVEDYNSINVQVNGKRLRYAVGYRLLNSKNFSVAQSRERLIYIAIRSDVMSEHDITPETIFEAIEQQNSGKKVYTLADALSCIKPLEAPRVKNQNEIDSESCGKKVDTNQCRPGMNAYLDLINMGRDLPLIFNHKARYCSDVNYEIYRRLSPGDDATSEKVRDIMPYAHRNHCFKDKYYKLFADRPCRTITAHLRMDCHSHIHPTQVRSLTPREAARVQSFPDDYLFMGAYLKTYMQVGNAVPPVMARGIAEQIKKYL